MPWSGSPGSETFSRTDGTRTGTTVWQQAKAAGVNIVSPDHDTHDQDIADGLNASFKKDGGNTATADLPMGGFKFTGVGNASLRDQFPAVGQYQDGSFVWCGTAGGTANALTLSPAPTIPALVTGMRLFFQAGSSASTTAVTIAVSGLATVAAEINDAALSSTVTIEANKYYLAFYDGTAFQLTRLSPNPEEEEVVVPVGECELVKDSTNLKLQRVNGRFITIDGTNETIPSAGVTLAPTGLSVSTLYYIYAYMDSGTMTLEASVTADAVDSTTGVAIKTGDATRTHVGWAYPVTGPAFADSETQRYVRSRFNPKPLLIKNAFTAIRTTSSATAAEVNTEIRIEFLAVPGDVLKADAAGYSFNNDVAGVTVSTVGLDGTSTIDPPVGVLSFGQAGDAVTAPAVFDNMSTGYHYITYVGRITGATGTYGFATVGLFNTLSGVIHPAQQ